MLDVFPADALPPETTISPYLLGIAADFEALISMPSASTRDILTVLRLGSPFGEIRGLACTVPGRAVAWPCQVALAFARKAGSQESVEWLFQFDAALRSPDLINKYPELNQRPRPNSNPIWDVHSRLSLDEYHLASRPDVSTYDLLTTDIQRGLIHALGRTHWMQSTHASDSLDASLTGLLRILPLIPADQLADAIDSGNDEGCQRLFAAAAGSLNYMRQPDTPLPPETREDYLKDCCRLLMHPEWASTATLYSSLGTGAAATVRESSWVEDDDDPPEVDDAPDRFREGHMQTLERQVSRELNPVSGVTDLLAEIAQDRTRPMYGEHLAVMREYQHPLAWHVAHPSDVACLVRMIYGGMDFGRKRLAEIDFDRLSIRACLMAMILTGRSADWLCRVVVGELPELGTVRPTSAPIYAPQADAIVFWPETMPELPTQPERAADLFEPVVNSGLIPLPGCVAYLWRECARHRGPGQSVLGIQPEQVRPVLNDVNQVLWQAMPNRPALTTGRLRASFTAIMETVVQLDPILAAYISGQWRSALRVPAFYITVSSDMLAERYRQAVAGWWELMTDIEPRLAQIPRAEVTQLPHFYMGSPYLPKSGILRETFANLKAQVASASASDDKHNAQTLLASMALSVLAGVRITEATNRQANDFDLALAWTEGPMPMLQLPETKGNRWTTAARYAPLSDPLPELLRAVLAPEQTAAALYFKSSGQVIPVTPTELRQRLKKAGVPFPRWNCGRHEKRTWLLDMQVAFDHANSVIGHQSAGREQFNPNLPGRPGLAWRADIEATRKLAQHLELI